MVTIGLHLPAESFHALCCDDRGKQREEPGTWSGFMHPCRRLEQIVCGRSGPDPSALGRKTAAFNSSRRVEGRSRPEKRPYNGVDVGEEVGRCGRETPWF